MFLSRTTSDYLQAYSISTVDPKSGQKGFCIPDLIARWLWFELGLPDEDGEHEIMVNLVERCSVCGKPLVVTAHLNYIRKQGKEYCMSCADTEYITGENDA